MTTLATVLNGAATITTTTTPSLGTINSYSASGGALAVALPGPIAGYNAGATMVLEKAVASARAATTADATSNAITFTTNTGDYFDDGSTTLVLNQPGEKRTLQVVQIPASTGTKYWKVVNSVEPKTGLAATTSQYSQASASATSVVAYTVPPVSLYAGATFRVTLSGTIATGSTASQTLTFTPIIQNTALAQTAVLTTSATNAASSFRLEYVITVRTTGTTGTAIAKPFGVAQMAGSGVQYLSSTSTATTAINTTSTAANTTLGVSAVWSNATGNTLLVETATIERVV